MEPLNIQRLVRQNKQYADASHHAQSITKGSIVSAWHEKHDVKGYTPEAGGLSCCTRATAAAGSAASVSNVSLDVATSSSRSIIIISSTTGRGAAKQELDHGRQALLQGKLRAIRTVVDCDMV
jgi:hypothetical protein